MELTKTTETTTNETISETKGGVYKITCTPLNKVYIGRSKNINQRKAEHFSDLRNNVHKCKEMQKDFNQYGENAFTFSIAEECDEEKAIWLEDYYMFHCSAFSHGYNTKRGDIINAKEKCIGDNVVECENVREKTFLEEAEEEKRSEQIRTCNYKDVSAQWLVFMINKYNNSSYSCDEVLNLIKTSETKFYIYKEELDGTHKTYCSLENAKKLYNKYYVYVENFFFPNKLKEDWMNVMNNSVYLLDDIIDCIISPDGDRGNHSLDELVQDNYLELKEMLLCEFNNFTNYNCKKYLYSNTSPYYSGNDYSIITESDMNYHIENSYFLKTLKETEDFSIYKMFIASIQKRMELTLNNVFEMNLKETIELSF